jgi:hypothetical protein
VIIADVAFAADVSLDPDTPEVPESSCADVSSAGGTSLMFEVSISVPWYTIPHCMA